MKRLGISWFKYFPPLSRAVTVALMLLGLLGLLDASFLTLEHYRGLPVPCSLTTGCEEVLTSKYAAILNVPLAVLGIGYYFFVVLLALFYLKTQKIFWLRPILGLTAFSFIVSIWLLYLQVFVIEALCFYCILSLITTSLLLALAAISYKLKS